MFMACVIQEAEGCDYTIGCGRNLWRLVATNKIDAIREVRQKVIGEWLPENGEYEDGYWDEGKLGELILFEVINEEKIPIEQWYVEAENYAKQVTIQAHENSEKAEYNRLKAKYDPDNNS